MLTLRLPKDMENRLDYLASMTGRTKSYYAKKAISQLMEDMEDLFIIIEHKVNPSKTIPHELVMKQLREEYGDQEVDDALAN